MDDDNRDIREVYPFMAEMNDELIASLKQVIEFLDGLMVLTPNTELADTINLLQDKLEELQA